jgi:hypothetical protein
MTQQQAEDEVEVEDLYKAECERRRRDKNLREREAESFVARMLKTTEQDKLLRRIKQRVAQQRKIAQQLKGLNDEQAARMLLEAARIRQMTPLQKQVYEYNKLPLKSIPGPLPTCFRYWFYLLAGSYITLCTYYVFAFGVQQGADVTNNWLLSMLSSLFFTIFVSTPAKVFVLHSLLPRLMLPTIQTIDVSAVKGQLAETPNLREQISFAIGLDGDVSENITTTLKTAATKAKVKAKRGSANQVVPITRKESSDMRDARRGLPQRRLSLVQRFVGKLGTAGPPKAVLRQRPIGPSTSEIARTEVSPMKISPVGEKRFLAELALTGPPTKAEDVVEKDILPTAPHMGHRPSDELVLPQIGMNAQHRESLRRKGILPQVDNEDERRSSLPGAIFDEDSDGIIS